MNQCGAPFSLELIHNVLLLYCHKMIARVMESEFVCNDSMCGYRTTRVVSGDLTV